MSVLLAPGFVWSAGSALQPAPDLVDEVASADFSDGSGVILEGPDPAEIVRALIAYESRASVVELRPHGVSGPIAAAQQGSTRWALYTSGTTGTPKRVLHTLDSLRRGVRDDRPRRWGLVYDAYRLAGMAVLLQAMATGSVLVDARAGTIAERVRAMRAGGVDALSATPTFWRQVLQTPEADGWPLEQITLGGEAADQPTLDRLARSFPGARVTHVFAATETGVAFSVGDGRAGFPTSYLADPHHGLDVRDGLLWVRNDRSSAASPDGFAPTGDLVEVVADRVLFRGRADGIANVGGVKVHPESVASTIRDYPGVVDASVSARSNALSGQILVALVTTDGTVDARALRRWLRERLPRPMVPAVVDIVESIMNEQTGKAVRA